MNSQMLDRVYAFICDYLARWQSSPTIREIAAGCYISPGNVYRYLDYLEARGLIIREPGRARSIRLPRPDDE